MFGWGVGRTAPNSLKQQMGLLPWLPDPPAHVLVPAESKAIPGFPPTAEETQAGQVQAFCAPPSAAPPSVSVFCSSSSQCGEPASFSWFPAQTAEPAEAQEFRSHARLSFAWPDRAPSSETDLDFPKDLDLPCC